MGWCERINPELNAFHTLQTFEFSLNVFTEFSDKNICHYSKRARTCHPVTSCVRDQDATTVPARYM